MHLLRRIEAAFHISHERGKFPSKRHAQTLKAAAATVSSINHGSVAKYDSPARTRQICARVIKPKTLPVVMR